MNACDFYLQFFRWCNSNAIILPAMRKAALTLNQFETQSISIYFHSHFDYEVFFSILLHTKIKIEFVLDRTKPIVFPLKNQFSVRL